MTQPTLTALAIELLNRLRQMSLAIRSSHASLSDKSGIWLRIDGLQDNMQYPSGMDSLESRGVMKPFYERLLEEWERSVDKENLTRDDFLRIQRAMTTLDTISTALHTGEVFGAVIGLMELLLWF